MILLFLLYIFVFLCLSSVSLYRKRWLGVCLIFILWTICYCIWYLYSPIFGGNPIIIKSKDRNIINDDVVRNWADTTYCTPNNIIRAKNVDDVVNILDNTNIRIVGSGHSWSPLICTNDTVVSLDFCSKPMLKNNVITIDAGCSIEEANEFLFDHGRVLYGFGGIQYQTIVGSIMTALHGSQYIDFGSHVVKMGAILANKTIITITDDLKYWRHSMGMLGVVISVDLKTYPIISLNKMCTLTDMEESISALKQNYFGVTVDSVWGLNQDSVELCIYSDPIEEKIPFSSDSSYELSFLYDNVILPTIVLLSNHVRVLDITLLRGEGENKRLSILDAWKLHIPGYGFISAEYSVPLDKCLEVVKKMKLIAYPNLVAIYIRRLNASDDLLSIAKVDSCLIDTSWVDFQYSDVYNLLKDYHTKVENLINKYNGNMHWGKFYASDTKKINIDGKFKQYREKIDPKNKFMNSYTTELIYGNQNPNRYTKFAIDERGTFWRIVWWTTFSVSIFSSIWCNKQPKGYTGLSTIE